MKQDIKDRVVGELGAIQTLLERYPVLLNVNPYNGDSSLSFMFNLLRVIGVTEEDIIKWLSSLLSESDGFLSLIEDAIKALLIAEFKDAYTCSINPVLPSDIMYSRCNGLFVYGDPIKINLSNIDYFGILENCPTSINGSMFYFDNETDKDYNPVNIYTSTDFNAYLWYVINKGKWINEKTIWDNRVNHRNQFIKEECLNGSYSENSSKGKFFATDCSCSKSKLVKGVGAKYEILSCIFKEDASESNTLEVYLNGDRYIGKTVFEFIFDYVNSLKLFDSKTLVAQIVNAVYGLSSINAGITFEQYSIIEKIKIIVQKIISKDDTSTDDCYYEFSNTEYDSMLTEAFRKYENSKEENTSKEKITDNVKLINNKSTSNDISEILRRIVQVTGEEEVADYFFADFGFSLVQKFLEELISQLSLQILSPKVMILYAINERIINHESKSFDGLNDFFKNFINIITTLIRKITDLILNKLLSFLIEQLKPLLILFVEKLLLETAIYYKVLITSLFENCSMMNISLTARDPYKVYNVIGADIVPALNNPEKSCKQ